MAKVVSMCNYIVCGIVESVNLLLDRRIAKFIFNVINSNNRTMASLINTFLTCESSVFADNYKYLMYKYNIPMRFENFALIYFK